MTPTMVLRALDYLHACCQHPWRVVGLAVLAWELLRIFVRFAWRALVVERAGERDMDDPEDDGDIPPGDT